MERLRIIENYPHFEMLKENEIPYLLKNKKAISAIGLNILKTHVEILNYKSEIIKFKHGELGLINLNNQQKTKLCSVVSIFEIRTYVH